MLQVVRSEHFSELVDPADIGGYGQAAFFAVGHRGHPAEHLHPTGMGKLMDRVTGCRKDLQRKYPDTLQKLPTRLEENPKFPMIPI